MFRPERADSAGDKVAGVVDCGTKRRGVGIVVVCGGYTGLFSVDDARDD